MINYIKSEFYRIFNKRSIKIMLFLVALLPIIFNFLAFYSGVEENLNPTIIVGKAYNVLTWGILFVIVMVDITTSQEKKIATLKNTISFGISRQKVFLSKIFIATSLTVMFMLILEISFIGSKIILFGFEQNFSMDILNPFIVTALLSILVWIGCVTIVTFLTIVFNNNTVVTLFYVVIFFVLSKNLVAFLLSKISSKLVWLGEYAITNQINILLSNGSSKSMLLSSSLVFIGYIAVFLTLGIMYFNKKEIK